MPLVLTATANPGVASWQNASDLGGSVGVYTIRPAGPADPDNNIYTTWADMYAVASVSVAPIKRVILDSPGVAVVVPAGTYDLAGYYFQGDVTRVPSQSVLSCGEGVVFENFTGNLHNMWLSFSGTATPLVTLDDGAIHVVQSGTFSAYINAGTVEMFSLDNNSVLSFFAQDFCLVMNSGYEIFAATAGCVTQISILNGADIDDDAVRGAGDVNALTYGGGGDFGTVQTNLTGALVASSQGYLYYPATPANWNTSPTTLQEAIDQLASAVEGLLGGPIP